MFNKNNIEKEEYIRSKFIENIFEPFMIKIALPIMLVLFAIMAGVGMIGFAINLFKLAKFELGL